MFLPLAWVLFRQSPGYLFSSSPTPWKENNIQPIDVDGNSSTQPGVEDLNGPTSLLLIDTDTRAGKRAGFGN
jgi:hypothetical protein